MKKIVTVVLMVLTIGLLLVGCGISQEVQDELNQMRSEKEQWAEWEPELNHLRSEKQQWAEWEPELNQLRFEKEQWAEWKPELNQLRSEKEQWGEDKQALEGQIAELNNQLAKLPKDPTYQEVMDFLRVDQTDKNAPIPFTYTTLHFSRDVYENAQKAGMRVGFVTLVLGGQVNISSTIFNFNAFDTTDKGIIFIWPEEDQVVRIKKGEKFFEANNWLEPDFEDTIIDFVTIWN